jgi:acetyltransferase-like isoleucine patch superfamily enzyme
MARCLGSLRGTAISYRRGVTAASPGRDDRPESDRAVPAATDREAGAPRHPSLSDHAPAPRSRRWANALIHAGWNWVSRYGATGPDDRLAARFGAFGPGTCLAFPTGAVFGEQWIHIGRDTLVGPHVSISAGMVPGQTMVTDPVVRIGDRCMIGRGSHIVGHFEVDIGDDVHTGPYVYITDQNHGYEDPDDVVHVQWPRDEPVRIGTGSWLGTGVVVLPGSRLGRNVVVGAGAVVRGTFPDHCVIAGVPARIVRRYVPGSGWLDGPPPAASGPTATAMPEAPPESPPGGPSAEDAVGAATPDGVVTSGSGRPSP